MQVILAYVNVADVFSCQNVAIWMFLAPCNSFPILVARWLLGWLLTGLSKISKLYSLLFYESVSNSV